MKAVVNNDEIENLINSITIGFQKHVRPLWDEIEKHCIWRRGTSAIYVLGKIDENRTPKSD